MITLLIGENSFEIERTLAEITNGFAGDVEKIDSGKLQLAQLPDILMGISLFATNRVIIIRNLSENKPIWSVFGDWISRISDDIHLVLIESKPDKRTSTYKSLKDNVVIREFQSWTDRDVAKAEKWVIAEAKGQGFSVDAKSAQLLVRRIGVDQWQLFHALEKLALVDFISADVINNVIEPNLSENVFELFETSLRGDIKTLKSMLRILEQSEDVFRLFALLSTQVFQLTAVMSAEKSDNVTKDFGIHPYVVQKLEVVAKRLGKNTISKIVKIFAESDDDMKISKAEPWLLLERALLKVASL
jgi:DNA polymerase-3 subunit delta